MVGLEEKTAGELKATVDEYPWFAAARAAYIEKVAGKAADSGSLLEIMKEHALFLPSLGDFLRIHEDRCCKFPSPRSGSNSVVEMELSPAICTETLARIYEKQQLFDKSIAIYEKLILLYPEKSAYFASLIDELKEKK